MNPFASRLYSLAAQTWFRRSGSFQLIDLFTKIAPDCVVPFAAPHDQTWRPDWRGERDFETTPLTISAAVRGGIANRILVAQFQRDPLD
jgi:hypothetical protein